MLQMNLKTYFNNLPKQERLELAGKCSTSVGHILNVAYGYRSCSPGLAVSIEKETKGAVSRKDLRSDWQEIWPELSKRKAVA